MERNHLVTQFSQHFSLNDAFLCLGRIKFKAWVKVKVWVRCVRGQHLSNVLTGYEEMIWKMDTLLNSNVPVI